MGDTALTLLMCADNSIVSKNKPNILVQFGTPFCFKALCEADPEHNAGRTRKSNPKHLFVLRLHTRGASGGGVDGGYQ